ncbi:hypothetical protein BD289DRAFT_453983 [Coniella lustricola]|uniref:Uncharacterized protein n=1 Tax=Coniella lustricola TaxID=2025994 RepID=A0A2T3A594_9PEZI|nr:hypothetical protein BD289DRAFT_453983 [Coniella lustricola]
MEKVGTLVDLGTNIIHAEIAIAKNVWLEEVSSFKRQDEAIARQNKPVDLNEMTNTLACKLTSFLSQHTGDDTAIKDLTFAVLMSANNGQITVNANWDKVTETMIAWGYGFSKGAMNQQWTKKILKEFRERHPDTLKRAATANGGGSTTSTPNKRTSAGARVTPTPSKKKAGSKRSRRDMEEEDDDDEEDLKLKLNMTSDEDSVDNDNSKQGGGHFAKAIKSHIAANRTPHRAASDKKIKYEDSEEDDNDGYDAAAADLASYQGFKDYCLNSNIGGTRAGAAAQKKQARRSCGSSGPKFSAYVEDEDEDFGV